jgi:CRP/FNR family transcriptional regulator, cyclic AMP receptor protein
MKLSSTLVNTWAAKRRCSSRYANPRGSALKLPTALSPGHSRKARSRGWTPGCRGSKQQANRSATLHLRPDGGHPCQQHHEQARPQLRPPVQIPLARPTTPAALLLIIALERNHLGAALSLVRPGSEIAGRLSTCGGMARPVRLAAGSFLGYPYLATSERAPHTYPGLKWVSKPDLLSAISDSILGTLPDELVETLLADGFLIEYPAGTAIYHERDEPRCILVVSGLVRAFLRSTRGRQVTFRYATSGDMLGTAVVVGGPMNTNSQAVTKTRAIVINTTRLRTLAGQDVRVAWALARDLDNFVNAVLDELAVNSFGSIRERAARHLLSLAVPAPDGSLVAVVGQQELADAVGSVREVVGRALRELRDEGVITATGTTISILNVSRLLRDADIQRGRTHD